jgi:hypothetical protein
MNPSGTRYAEIIHELQGLDPESEEALELCEELCRVSSDISDLESDGIINHKEVLAYHLKPPEGEDDLPF